MTPNLIIAKDDTASTGAVVYWSLTGDIDGSRLIDEWLARRLPLDLLPKLPAPETALRRAVQDQTERHLLARKNDEDGSWYLVKESVGDSSTSSAALEFSLGIRFCLDEESMVAGHTLNGSSDEGSRVIAAVCAAYDHYRNSLTPHDISPWLSDLPGKAACGLTLRERSGGFYYIPNMGLDFWTRAVEAVKASSAHTFHSLPAMRCEQALEAVLDALNHEVGEATDKMFASLEDNLGTRAIRTRIEQTSGLRSKVAAYEQLLGKGLDDLRGKIESLSASWVVASLKAEAEADKAAEGK